MELDEGWIANFKESLDKAYAWPSLYTFKFIVPAGLEADVQNLFPRHTNTARQSRNGKYTSLTFQMMMPSSDAVVSVYKTAASIEGLIAL
jgi:uncharacterized protein